MSSVKTHHVCSIVTDPDYETYLVSVSAGEQIVYEGGCDTVSACRTDYDLIEITLGHLDSYIMESKIRCQSMTVDGEVPDLTSPCDWGFRE